MSKWSGGSLLKLGAGIFGAAQQYEHGKSLKRSADRNADRVAEENEESKRRSRREQRQRQSQLRARAAASGIKLSGSTKTFLDDQVNEDERQLSWLDRSGKSQESILRKQGKDDKKNAQYGAYGSFFKTAGSWLGS